MHNFTVVHCIYVLVMCGLPVCLDYTNVWNEIQALKCKPLAHTTYQANNEQLLATPHSVTVNSHC